jgi:succinate-semialdehyde dehydrogenase/glutarate-semialdehyde dehydrogenase
MMITAAARTKLNTGLNTDLFIDGQWSPATTGATFPVENPATLHVLAHVADGHVADAERAIQAAAAAQAGWAATSPHQRADILRASYEIILDRTDELAALMTAEMGKPLAEARGEVTYGAEFFRWFSEEAARINGDSTTTTDGTNRILVTKEPVGPCVLITPWNFPLAMGTRKIGPAIAAGCTMVFKPAELTPLTALALAGILTEAGLPSGVLNVVTTSTPAPVVEHWMSSGIARKISFTGSTSVGKILLRQAAENVMRSSMELGGNAPFIVLPDADLDKALDGAIAAKMRNMGEACTAANRLYVHRDIVEDFSRRLAKRMDQLIVGDGAADTTQVGPLIEQAAVTKVRLLVQDAITRGARVLTANETIDQPGYFYPPTVLVDVPADAEMNSTEIFGPVAPITIFDTDDEVIRAANNSAWGLAAYVYTQDLDKADRYSRELEVGMVGINTGIVSNPAAPFGGIKQSGLGREGGRVGIDEFLEYKYTAMPITGRR